MASPTTYKERRPDYRRIADGLRREILAGKFAPEIQLPSARDLAVTWKSSVFTIHSAIQELTKEGWLITRGSAGTYLADAKSRFVCAGIYHCADIFSNELMSFSRAVHTSLLNQLHQLGKTVQVFLDPRPSQEHSKLLPALQEAILYRHVQCLIAPTIGHMDAAVLADLNVPTSFISNPSSRNYILSDKRALFRDGLRELATQGCRTVGLISHIRDNRDAGNPEPQFYHLFREEARKLGLAFQDNWIRPPNRDLDNFERHGYEQFHKLWKLRGKPDGLIVYPDVVVRGTISAVLELGMSPICSQMKFLFHRNAGTDVLCPFDATWAILDPAQVAAELINLVRKQYKGEETSPVHLPHTFENGRVANRRKKSR